MKLILILFGFLFTTAAFSQSNPNEDIYEIACREQQVAGALMDLRGQRNYAADQTDMYYTEFHWDLDPAVYYIKGEITYYFKSKVDTLKQLVLDLDTTMHIHYVRRGNTDLSYIHSDDLLLTIDLNKSLNPEESDTLTISYEGIPHSTGFGSFEKDAHNGHPILWTQSVPYGVRDWWPSKQDLIDKIDSVDIYITTPLNQLAASNGKLISITEENGKLVHHWKHKYPIVSYLVAFSITNYTSYEEFIPLPNGDTLQVLNYVYPESLNEAKAGTPAIKNMMQFYNDKFGLYPYAEEKFGHAQFSWGGGTEIQTMNFVTNFSSGLLAHELAHQWFGDKTTCGSYADTWLNEGFATYLTGLIYEEFPIYGSFNNWKSSTRNSVVSEPGGSVFVADTADTFRIFDSRLTYNKGAYVLHMLRWVVGDDNWYQACYNYLHLPHTNYGFGRTRDLQNEMETVSGKDLDEFFADWYYGEGYPTYNIDWWQHNDSIGFIIHQSTSTPTVDFFEMPVPIQVVDGPNTYEFICNNTLQNQEFVFYKGDAEVKQIYIDLNKWLLSKNNTLTEIIIDNVESNQLPGIKIWPNPTHSSLHIDSPVAFSKVLLINSQGLSTPFKPENDQVNLDNLPPGLYSIRLFNAKDEPVACQRVVKF
ncbi:MAG TPA: M1 family metallopeptidase [Saprospiraceae bacterium]|nr:M1 family metallopeptidase [Saprospiraceae bacterium]